MAVLLTPITSLTSPVRIDPTIERTIYVGTLKGTLATVNREDMADVQAHKLGQARWHYVSIHVYACMHHPNGRTRPGSITGVLT